MPEIVLEAHAKINLALEVIGRRGDGFHDLVSVMQTITLADSITIREAHGVEVVCSRPELGGPANLTYRAATILRSTFDINTGCSIHIEKRIPVAAGLGGGSSDAAATLIGLARLWQLDARCQDLRSIAEQLGSDVPFFLYAGTCLIEGRGDDVRRLNSGVRCWYVLANPAVPVRTADVFGALHHGDFTDGEAARDLGRRFEEGGHPRIGPNALMRPLFDLVPEARSCYERLAPLAPGRTFVSGSGPTIGALFTMRADAEAARRALGDALPWVVVAESCIPVRGAMPCA